MPYVVNRGEWKHFNLKVPTKLRELGVEDREHIQFSLKTKCPDTAQKLASLAHDYIQSYWADLLENGADDRDRKLKRAIDLVQLHGLRYKPVNFLAKENVEEIVYRIEKAAEKPENREHVAAILGGAGESDLKWSELLEKFWAYAAPKMQNKSDEQNRVWKNSRKRAVANFIEANGDIRVVDTNRQHILDFRDWWMDRIEAKDLSNNTANDEFSFIKNILKTVDTNFQPSLNLPVTELFREIRLESQGSVRAPYSVDFIQNVLMSKSRLAGMNEDFRLIIYAFASTGAGPRELVMRTSEDIVLDHEIPHIRIVRRKKDGLKTKYREREIPLVGSALYAFQRRPEGFTNYRDKVNSLTSGIGKFLRENELYERENQTLYSLRHTFQDRLTALRVGDRVQCDLMGHSMASLGREEYGEGATLEHKLEVLKQMAFEVTE